MHWSSRINCFHFANNFRTNISRSVQITSKISLWVWLQTSKCNPTMTTSKKIKEWKNSTCWLILVVIVKLWFSVLLNLETLIVNHPRVTYDVALSNLWMIIKCTIKIGITPQNMPQTSNSLLSPTKSMVARGNQW